MREWATFGCASPATVHRHATRVIKRQKAGTGLEARAFLVVDILLLRLKLD